MFKSIASTLIASSFSFAFGYSCIYMYKNMNKKTNSNKLELMAYEDTEVDRDYPVPYGMYNPLINHN